MTYVKMNAFPSIACGFLIFRLWTIMKDTVKLKSSIVASIFLSLYLPTFGQPIVLRFNQAGYLPNDKKVLVVQAKDPVVAGATVVDTATGKTAHSAKLLPADSINWGSPYPRTYLLDLSSITDPGTYRVKIDDSNVSATIRIGLYQNFQEDLVAFMRQQRCGYNPFLDAVCHLHDGRSFYGPMPDESFIDVSGGWHDAGDQLKYLLTASNATARMMLAYELEKDKFDDRVDSLGRDDRPNGIPDVLDEAKWGLDWIHKLHPAADQLIHQVADDRDHRGFKLPDQDNADYGWGPNSYRPAYFADGKPQGLSQFKSKATGVANLAGRSAAAMAMAYRIWRFDLKDRVFAEKCLKAAIELYAMGKRQEGYQQGNSFGAPYRYNEDTWADDMEFAAAELFLATRKASYIADAKRYARIAATDTWMEFSDASMGEQMSRHYEKYPFTNIGHFVLYPLVGPAEKRELAEYYRSGIERIVARGRTNSYGVGVPFLWCSNNLVVAFITQVYLYERMTGDKQFHDALLAHRDWLLGRNPWGTSMFEGIPQGGEFPEDTHLPIVQILKKQVRGGLVDGPIDAATYKGLIGLTLNQPDEFSAVQPRDLFYHDDVGDYSTNEPTMDGTADAILVMAMFSKPHSRGQKGAKDPSPPQNPRFTYVEDGVIRGDKTSKQLALVFTGDEFAEGGTAIADALAKHNVKASFFLTGRFYRTRANRQIIERLKRDGHYLGPHSDEHLLYADWSDRNKTLVTRERFERDLNDNFAAMRPFDIDRKMVKFFLPPYEWYNHEIADWANKMGYQIVNFTPGTRSNADYMADDDKNYISSDAILTRIKEYEAKDPNGLNGFVLLTHIGSGPKRSDKFSDRVDELITWLVSAGYKPVRVDELLDH